MSDNKVYVKIGQNIEIRNTRVYLQDIAKLYGRNGKMIHELNKLEVMVIQAKENTKYMMSILRIIELIEKKYPQAEVVNMGEKDFIISYMCQGKNNTAWEYMKAAFVCAIIAIGSAFSIMTFNTDVSVSDVFTKCYEIVLGKGVQGNGIVELSYSIGLPIGICVFFNHFSRKKTRVDPTPLQIEMRTYEEDENKALIQDAAREGKTLDAH